MTGVKRVVFLDRRGRKYTAEIPEEVPDIEAYRGAIVGPPDVVEVLGLPEPVATEVHNALHDRGVLTTADAKRPGIVFGALQAALKMDQFKIISAYDLAEAAPEIDPAPEGGEEEAPEKTPAKRKTAPDSEADPVP